MKSFREDNRISITVVTKIKRYIFVRLKSNDQFLINTLMSLLSIRQWMLF